MFLFFSSAVFNQKSKCHTHTQFFFKPTNFSQLHFTCFSQLNSVVPSPSRSSHLFHLFLSSEFQQPKLMNTTVFILDASESQASVEVLPISAALLLAHLHIGALPLKKMEISNTRKMHKACYHASCHAHCP